MQTILEKFVAVQRGYLEGNVCQLCHLYVSQDNR